MCVCIYTRVCVCVCVYTPVVARLVGVVTVTISKIIAYTLVSLKLSLHAHKHNIVDLFQRNTIKNLVLSDFCQDQHMLRVQGLPGFPAPDTVASQDFFVKQTFFDTHRRVRKRLEHLVLPSVIC